MPDIKRHCENCNTETIHNVSGSGMIGTCLDCGHTFNKKEKKMNIYEKMLKISEEMGRLPKAGYNAFHKYNYVTEADALEKFRDLCVSNKVMVVPSVLSSVKEGDITTASIEYTIIDVEKPEFTVKSLCVGQGQDKGDKGIYKAITGAYKYFIMKTFMVPTGDDPEREEQKPKGNYTPTTKPASKPSGSKYDVCSFGKNKGQRWDSMEIGQLEWYQGMFLDNSNDSAKANFKDDNVKMHQLITDLIGNKKNNNASLASQARQEVEGIYGDDEPSF